VSYSRTFTNERIKISDIAGLGIISDTLFSECTILGPAVLMFMDSSVQLENNTFAASIDQVYWEVPASRPGVTGAIGLTNCRFERCEMIKIGIAGPRELGDALGASLSALGPQNAPMTSMRMVELGPGAKLGGRARIEHNVMIGTSQGPVNIEGDREAISEIIRELRQALPDSGLTEDSIHAVEEELAAAHTEATSDSPGPYTIRQRIGSALRLIQTATEFTTASTGLVEAVEKAHRMLPGI
jgi:hypothetical protein